MIEDILFLFTGIIGLVTILLMVSSYKSNQFFNIFLMLIFVIISTRFLIHGSYNLKLQMFAKPDKGLSSLLYLVIVPCFYLYYKNIVLKEKKINLNCFKHFVFIPFIILLNTIPFLQNSFIFYFGELINIALVTLFLVFYICKTFFLLRERLWNLTDVFVHFKHYKLVKTWTIFLFAHNVLGISAVLVSIYTEYNLGLSLSGKFMSIILLLSWLIIYFKILISPEILYGLTILNKKLVLHNESIEDENLTNDDYINNWETDSVIRKNSQDLRLQENIKSKIQDYINYVEKLGAEEHIFRDSKISQSDIAKKMNIPTSHLVYLFKYHSKLSFSEYRMRSRIEDAKQLLKDGYLKLNTFESLAEKTGFSSYNPFFTAFKKQTGYSPKEYISSTNNLQTDDSENQFEIIID